MGLFGKKETDTTPATAEVVKAPAKPKGPIAERNIGSVIIKPRITEKAALLGEKNVYTFEVKRGASKFEVRDAIKALYNVTPIRVNMVHKRPRHSMSRSRGRDMMEHGLQKAYVYLKKGDRIELV
jgi:large subunit ribosomal protein L23